MYFLTFTKMASYPTQQHVQIIVKLFNENGHSETNNCSKVIQPKIPLNELQKDFNKGFNEKSTSRKNVVVAVVDNKILTHTSVVEEPNMFISRRSKQMALTKLQHLMIEYLRNGDVHCYKIMWTSLSEVT